MYAALNQDGILVDAQKANGGEKYYCCHCARQVKLILTESRRYFRHANKVNNEINERIIHMKGKNVILSEVAKFNPRELATEVFLPKIQQRPDILVDNQIAIEYQCAKLDTTTLESRVKGYRKINMTNIWVLGGGYLDNHVRREHLKFISYTRSWGHYLLMLDSEHKTLTLFHHIQFVGPFNKIYFQRRIFHAQELGQIFNFQPQVKSLYPQQMTPYLLKKIRRQTDKESQRVKLAFYQRRKMTVEEYLDGQIFSPIRPIYTHPAWQMHCGQKRTRLNQPLLDNKNLK